MSFFKVLVSTVALAALTITACKSEQKQGSNPATPSTQARQSQAQKGEPLFKQYCASCHPDGGNVTDPKNNLRKSTLKAKHINRPEDIVAVMRKPASRMIRFDVSTISDADALAIADYILETF